MAVSVPVNLGTFFTSAAAQTQAITPTSNVSTGQIIYVWVFTQSTIGAVTVTGAAGTWATDIAEFSQAANCFGQLLRYVVPLAENGTAPTWTMHWGSSHTATWDVFGLTGAHQTSPTLASNTTTYSGAGSPRTGPSLTPSVTNCRIITCYGDTATVSSAATNSGASWTSLMTQFQTGKATLVDYTTALAGTSTINDTSTWNSTNVGLSAIFAVQPAPAASAAVAEYGPALALAMAV